MTGAESLIRTLIVSGVEVCFANPGTTELQMVIALDRLDVVDVIFANRVYKILYGELRATGAEPGRASETPSLTSAVLTLTGWRSPGAWAWKRFVWRRWRLLPTRSALPADAEDPSSSSSGFRIGTRSFDLLQTSAVQSIGSG